jgi:selenide, water dikinase
VQTERRLTSFSHGAGCGCKLGPEDLIAVLDGLVLPPVPAEVLVAADTGDDAAVYRLPSGDAVVATLDFFTPIVDDPYDWGRIAATNALSDVYAMGGRPFLALNIVAWPVDDLPREALARVLQGGIDAASAAGVAVLGGHSITDPEPKYGMVVLGLVDADRIVRNSTAAPGATLMLSKPLGLGIVSTAVKRGVAPDDLVATAVDLMTTTNAAASAAMLGAGAEAATDVTGFGLLGHLRRMLEASGCAAVVDASAVPLIPGVLDLARADVVPGGSKRNHAWLRGGTDWGDLTTPEQLVLADAQTSGGLLVATRRPDALAGTGSFAPIGEVVAGPAGTIRVTGRLRERHEVATVS